ncbi:MAG: hypothetical protein MUC65_03020, partial [Pontiellaceae bacterium]|nr:hypothetical protein [Pontiellaceae bacterium]
RHTQRAAFLLLCVDGGRAAAAGAAVRRDGGMRVPEAYRSSLSKFFKNFDLTGWERAGPSFVAFVSDSGRESMNWRFASSLRQKYLETSIRRVVCPQQKGSGYEIQKLVVGIGWSDLFSVYWNRGRFTCIADQGRGANPSLDVHF